MAEPDTSSAFIIFPAIDIQGGQAVRLRQGKESDSTVYFKDPLEPAKNWKAAGSDCLHLVDLDGAFKGKPQTGHLLSDLADLGLFTQIGGGIRKMADVEAPLERGISRVILGTKALEDRSFLKSAIKAFPDRVAVGIDARDGKVATRGWVETSEVDALDFAKEVADLGVKTIIYTDISTDGMMTGPNLEAQEAMAGVLPEDAFLIASGGVSKLDDIGALADLGRRCPALKGVITGRALYDGTVDLAEAIQRYQVM